MSLQENLKTIRSLRKLSQQTLADRAGIPQSQISDLERGGRKSINALPEIALALDVTPGDLDERFRWDKFKNATSGPVSGPILKAALQGMLETLGLDANIAETGAQGLLAIAKSLPTDTIDSDTLNTARNQGIGIAQVVLALKTRENP